jgi:hypothetical protein
MLLSLLRFASAWTGLRPSGFASPSFVAILLVSSKQFLAKLIHRSNVNAAHRLAAIVWKAWTDGRGSIAPVVEEAVA